VSRGNDALTDVVAATECLEALFRPANEPPNVDVTAGAFIIAVTLHRLRALTE